MNDKKREKIKKNRKIKKSKKQERYIKNMTGYRPVSRLL